LSGPPYTLVPELILTIRRVEMTPMRLRKRAAIAVAILSTTACNTGGPAGPLTREHHDVDRGAATRARVEINMSAGDLTVQSGATQLFEGDFEFNVAALKPAVAYAVDGATGVLKVSQGSVSGNYENNWHLPRQPDCRRSARLRHSDDSTVGADPQKPALARPRAWATPPCHRDQTPITGALSA